MKLWKGHLWSRSYCLLTTGQTTLDVLKRYVEYQGDDIIDNKENETVENGTCHVCGW